MSNVRVREGETLDSALKRFNRETLEVVKELRKRAFHEKPSVIKKRDRAERARKIKSAQRYLA